MGAVLSKRPQRANCPSEMLQYYSKFLDPKIQIYLRGARNQDWPYIPEPWQFPEFGITGDLRELLARDSGVPETAATNEDLETLGDDSHSGSSEVCADGSSFQKGNGGCSMRPKTAAKPKSSENGPNTQYELLRICLLHSIEGGLYQEAISIVFVIDRFAYWLDQNETRYLMKVVQEIVDQSETEGKVVAVPPQIMIRKARILKDDGALQAADMVLTLLLDQCAEFELGKPKPGQWPYKARDQFLIAAANFLELKAQVRSNLGQWMDAAQYFVGAIQIANSIKTPDNKEISICLQFLTDLLRNVSDSDYNELMRSVRFAGEGKALGQAHKMNSITVELTKSDAFFHFRRLRKNAEIQLQVSIQTAAEDRNVMFEQILCQIRGSLLANITFPATGREQVFEYANIFYVAHLCMEKRGLFEGSSRARNLAKALYFTFCISKARALLSEEEMRREVNEIKKILDTIDSDEIMAMPPSETYPVLVGKDPMEWISKPPEAVVEVEASVELSTDSDRFGDSHHKSISQAQPGATTHARSTQVTGASNRELGIFSDKSQSYRASDSWSVEAQCGDSYRSLVTEPEVLADGFEAPMETLEIVTDTQKEESLDSVDSIFTKVALRYSDPEVKIPGTKLIQNWLYDALVFQYHPIDNQWRASKTLVCMLEKLKLREGKEGQMRDVALLKFLHQDEHKSTYVGKWFKRPKPPRNYYNDVRLHQISRHYVTMFNQELQHLPNLANQIQMVPVVHIRIVDHRGIVIQHLNVEPFISGAFTKITNNKDFVNTRVKRDLPMAFMHYTWCRSGEKLIVTDLQGWVPSDPRVAVILTDPAIHSPYVDNLGDTNFGQDGITQFWTKQHPPEDCGKICRLLGLWRPENL